MVYVIPAILTNDPKELVEKMRALEGIAKRVQIDIVDGVFANNKTVLPDVISSIETDLLLDFHLMTKEPTDWVERCVEGQADRIVGHIEKMTSQRDFVGKVSAVGAKVGLALDLETPVSAVEGAIMNNLDVVLVMSTKAGFGGQDFDGGALGKIKQLNEIRARDNTPFRICADGGINEDTIRQVVEAGADEVAIGVHLFTEDLEGHIKKLREAAYG